MATVEESHPLEPPATNTANLPKDVTEQESLKRKLSVDEDDGSPKRVKHNDNHAAADDQPGRRESTSSSRAPREPDSAVDRRKLATQEEKKRGKRLFGGLLSTLSQTTSNSQQKRRQEIERRQQERLQKQKTEDDQKRAEKLARLHDVRMAEQIAFEEDVMRHRHSKILETARYLRTQSKPHIYYLPWKPSSEQEDQIDEQIKEAKAIIEKELDSCKDRKERHIRNHGRPKRSRTLTVKDEREQTTTTDESQPPKHNVSDQAEKHQKPPDKEHHHHHHNHHDESADVLEEADEDMVIY